MAGVVRGVRFDEKHVPVAALRQIGRNVGEALVVEVEQLEVGVVVEDAQRVAQRVLDEGADLVRQLLGHAGRHGPVAAGRPDLRRQQLEAIGGGGERD